MISEGSCDTENWSNDADNSALISLKKKRDCMAVFLSCFGAFLKIILNICKIVCAFLKTLKQMPITYLSKVSIYFNEHQ